MTGTPQTMATTQPDQVLPRKTPTSVTEFEREQLRFFLSQGGLSEALATLNPSLSWLAFFIDNRIVNEEDKALLASWITRNFTDHDAVPEVVANLQFFNPETAEILDRHLIGRTQELPGFLAQSWRLIIQALRAMGRIRPRGEWFVLQPRIISGDTSSEVMNRLSELLRPSLRLSPRRLLPEERTLEIERHRQLMEIHFQVDDDFDAEAVLSAWPQNADPTTDRELLSRLTTALDTALQDAIDAGVDAPHVFGVSDSDVPSVAAHPQNAHRGGFLPIVRVMADLWERLAKKAPELALSVLEEWKRHDRKVMRRLVLFASVDPIVSADAAADALISLPSRELFMAGAPVEVFRLIRARWQSFPTPKRDAILHRVCEGPPRESCPPDMDLGVFLDLTRFDLLAEMERRQLPLNTEANGVLQEIRSRRPHWEPRPPEQAGFHIWSESHHSVPHDITALQEVEDADLVATAERLAKELSPSEGSPWQGLCLICPDRAARGLAAAADKGNWPTAFWQSLLRSTTQYAEPETENTIALSLGKCPLESFKPIGSTVSWWLDEHSTTLSDAAWWSVWDRVATTSLGDPDGEVTGNALQVAMNSSAGQLAGALIKRLATRPSDTRQREKFLKGLSTLIAAPGRPGYLARIRLAADVALLFERVPDWTKNNLLPLFDWTHPEAPEAWIARKYARSIGSPELFKLTKQPLLNLFAREGIGAEEIRTYAEWFVVVLIAKRKDNIPYPLTEAEVRAALRHAARNALPAVANRLAREMAQAKSGDKIQLWKTVIGPIFQGAWPRDVDLQTPAATYALVHLLRASEEAAPLAADVVLPFIRADIRHIHSTIVSLSTAPETVFTSAPKKMLDVAAAVVGNTESVTVFGLGQVLEQIRSADPSLVTTAKFQRLLRYSGRS